MQRLYSRFPGGWPGAVLLLLRVTIGVTLIVQGAAYVPELQGMRVAVWTVCLLILAAGLALLIGLFTRVFGGVAVLSFIALSLVWLPTPANNMFSSNPLDLDVIIMALVCTLLGPGAYSLDARWFGHRKIIIPNVSSVPNS